jgi:hypothetical protein
MTDAHYGQLFTLGDVDKILVRASRGDVPLNAAAIADILEDEGQLTLPCMEIQLLIRTSDRDDPLLPERISRMISEMGLNLEEHR